MTAIRGYTLRALPSSPVRYSDGVKPAWLAQVRRKGWRAGYWVTVKNTYGPLVYTSPQHAKDAAHLWAVANETRVP